MRMGVTLKQLPSMLTVAQKMPVSLNGPSAIFQYELECIHAGKYQPKMIRPCDWTFETKVIIVCDSFFRKPISIVHCLSLL